MLSENLVRCLEQSIKTHWELPALSDYKGQTLTYSDVAHNIGWLHEVFKKIHLKQGDKIAVVGKNSVHWCLTYLATVTYSAVIVPILPDFNAGDVHHIVTHSDAVLLFVSDQIFESLDESKMPHLKAIFSLNRFELLYTNKKHVPQILQQLNERSLQGENALSAPEQFSLPEVPNNELASIVYTSGTTGFSKGVMLAHNSLIANVMFAQHNMPLKPGDTIVSFLPLAHAYGCAFEFLFPFSVGCHITLLSKTPSPKIILQAFQDVRPRLILSVPLVIEKIYQKKIKPVLQKPALRWAMKIPPIKHMMLRKIEQSLTESFGGNFFEIIIGGAALNEEVEAFLKTIGFRFTIGYGMTECGPLVSYAPWNDHRPTSVGRSITYLEVKIREADPQTGVGAIVVRGENVMQGYYKNDNATKEVLDESGWLDIGDLGSIDDEGFIYIKGRYKNMLVGPSGQNIYPEEIEARLNNLPFVLESLVLEKQGKLVALVYPDLERADVKGLSEAQIAERLEENRKRLNTHLPAYSAISKIELYPKEFEKTPTRKIKRFLYKISLENGVEKSDR
ncbi:long-chain fatty acid--CoA ligase [candidate division KSB3 bacterium]|uniref:Long-chain fatty acid--CoA ligase n=1 Tax=candidate division KSB3 bacterium TaxID=2044937 RepID=A0A2G6K9R0_9BACT|nr:MAG: long-chain fatty acid--CoA ligase [candidate division KSB3 bacterium]